MTIVLLTLLLSLHPIHVSIAEVDYNADAKALQITLRIFIDDLELSIRNKVNSPEMDLLNPGGSKSTDQLVSDYLSNALKLKVDKKAVQTNYLGHEIEGPAMICYIEVPNIRKFKSIGIKRFSWSTDSIDREQCADGNREFSDEMFYRACRNHYSDARS